MPELLLELLSEEIPARMQQAAGNHLRHAMEAAFQPLNGSMHAPWYTPRRLAVWGEIDHVGLKPGRIERGPKLAAPDAALQGFTRKFGVQPEQLEQSDGYWVLRLPDETITAEVEIGARIPRILREFPWPKSMRWGAGSAFTWVRPLHSILCVYNGVVVPFDLALGSDDGHGLSSGAMSRGHRFMHPETFTALSWSQWQSELAQRKVVADPAKRLLRIKDGVAGLAAAKGLFVVPDDALLDEVCGLVEWPVPLLGRIDAGYMALPAEVMQVSMRVNQRYFQLVDAAGAPAPYFAFVANIDAPDGNVAIVAGNERVLRARFADAQHFWELDRVTRLESRIAALHDVTFHARLGTQADRVRRLTRLAAHIAPLVGADIELASRAAALAKADLTTGMVGEFPELQGIMGGYYAAHDGEAPEVAQAVREHYLPKGPADGLPTHTVGLAVDLADRLDTLAGFFGIGEIPSGSGDPYALRRAALGVIRMLREHALRLDLRALVEFAGGAFAARPDTATLLAFLAERLRVQLRSEGARHDVLNAVFASGETDIVRLLARADALAGLLGTESGSNLLAAYRRAANILRIEDRKDGPHAGSPDPALFNEPAEHALYAALVASRPRIGSALAAEEDAPAMAAMAELRPSVDAFFEDVKVNDTMPDIRANRLRLLGTLRDTMNTAADFSRIEG